MANCELRFLCLSKDKSYVKVNFFQDNDLTVEPNIDLRIVNEEGQSILVQLDKSTAIKFAKTIRTEINKF